MIRVGIVGYGNLGRGVCYAVNNAKDMECVGIFTRRNADSIKPVIDVNVYNVSELKKFKDKIDVLLLCGGSATDLPQTTEKYLKDFNTVDSFDTHANIPQYFSKLDQVAKENDKVCAISIGWDPGLFSIMRLISSSVLPNGQFCSFWGKGVSQGHSDAIRRISGVKNAIQYTIPKEEALSVVRNGEKRELTARDKHLRECFVCVEEGADKAIIEREIKNMPNYFADYDTIVHFVSEEELKKNHSKLSHGGVVVASGKTTEQNSHAIEFSLKLDSNPEFTGSVLVSYARAVYRLKNKGEKGAFTVYDIPLKYISPLGEEELRSSIL